MNVIDELKIVLGLDSSGVQKGMKQAENSISSGISSITAKLGALSAAITAAFSLGAAFSEYTKTADAMGKLADAIDVDISKMHAWSEAAIRAGGSAEGFQSSLEQMSGQLARIALTGTSRMKKVSFSAVMPWKWVREQYLIVTMYVPRKMQALHSSSPPTPMKLLSRLPKSLVLCHFPERLRPPKSATPTIGAQIL